MKILLVSANRETIPYPVEPLGVAYVAASLLEAGHDVRLVDLCFAEDGPAEAAAAAGEHGADLVGVSIRNVDNLTYPGSRFYLPAIREVVSALRERHGAPVVVGGSGFSLFPSEALSYLGADFGIAGEGEEAMVELASAMEKGADLSAVPGLVTAGGGTVCTPRRLDPFGALAPARSLLDYRRYGEWGGMANIQTKRGCPFECSYCTYPVLEGRSLRLRDAEGVADEVARLKADYGTRFFFFVDDIFNVPQSHAIDICEELIRRDLGVDWACFVNPKHVSGELFAAMKAAGCTAMEFGTDGGTDATLEALGKGFTVSEVERAQKEAAKAGIEAAHYLIMGGPGETEETVGETFALMERLGPRAVIAMLGLRIYPGTGLADTAVAEGLIGPGESLLEPRFYVSPAVSSTLLETVGGYARGVPNWVVPGLDIRSSADMSKALAALGKSGVMWDLL